MALEEVETDSLFAKVSGRVLCNAYDVVVPVDLGDYLVLRGRLKAPQPVRNPGGYDQRRFLSLQGIYGLVGIHKNEQIERVDARPGSLLDEWLVLPVRRSIQRTIERNLSGAPAGLLRGMLLGEKYRVPSETRERFRAAGLAHALVISGLHVGLIAVFCFGFFKLCRLPDRWTALMTVAALAFYALITEMQAPVMRAVLMAAVVLVGRCIGRQGEIYNSLGLAAMVILAVWPSSLLGLSFQLSFGATLNIVALHGPLTRLWPLAWQQTPWLGKWLIDPLCVSLAAQVGTGPLLAFHFQHFAPVGPLANLAVVPLLGVAVGLGVLAALVGAWWPLAATAFNGSNFLVLKGLIALVDFCAAVPYGLLTTSKPDLVFVGCAAVLCLLLSHAPTRLGARKAAVFLLLLYLNWAVWSQALKRHDLEVVFFDVGQGDGAFVRCPNGRTLIIDGGEANPYFDYGQRVLLPFLRQRNIGRVDVVVASHPHSDHVGGLVSLLEAVEVGHYLDAGQQYDLGTTRQLAALIRRRGIRYHAVAARDSLAGLGGVGALVLHPGPGFVEAAGEAPHGLNNGSVVLRLDYGRTRLLFTGDVEKEAEPALLGWGERLRADILKVPHHGSRTSSQVGFVDLVQPRLAVISVGSFNKFRHPASEVLRRYLERGVEVLRTDQYGAVILHSDGQAVRLRTMVGPD
jgi:competence protein ComEC